VIAALLLALGLQTPKIVILDPQDEKLRPTMERHVVDGVRKIEEFFGKPFPKPYRLELLPGRAAFDKVLKDRFSEESPGPWAIGAATSDCLYMITPRVWRTEAAEHDPDNHEHIRRIIAHELTHTYHAQVSPAKDFEGMEDLAWLSEGLAAHVSGQMDEEYAGREVTAVNAGRVPKSLATAWSGRDRYPICGSIVRYVEKRYGRPKLIELLKMTKETDILKALDTTESKLLKDWQESFAN
jgi:hypothetical protein